MKYVLAALMMPGLAMASALETDFDQIFADNAALVEENRGVQSIELPGKIVLSRNPEGKYLALDGSPHEAVGCVLQVTLQSVAVSNVCPQSASEDQKARLQSNLENITAFYAANNVPARAVEDVAAELDSALNSLQARMAGLTCSTEELSDFVAFLAALVSDDAQSNLQESLATPRLPVTNPCL